MNLPVFINDGMTFDGYIDQMDRMHGSISFKFRLYMPEHRAELITKLSQCSPAEGERFAAMATARHILEWDVVDTQAAEKTVLPITYQNIVKLHPRVNTKLFKIIIGDMAPDARPEATRPAHERDIESEFIALLDNETPEEAREKNLLEV